MIQHPTPTLHQHLLHKHFTNMTQHQHLAQILHQHCINTNNTSIPNTNATPTINTKTTTLHQHFTSFFLFLGMYLNKFYSVPSKKLGPSTLTFKIFKWYSAHLENPHKIDIICIWCYNALLR